MKRTAPDRRLARAFTSTIIRRLLSAREGDPGRVRRPGIARGAGWRMCWFSPYILFGNEYEKICREMAPWKDRFAALTLGPPLLGGTDDLRQLARSCRQPGRRRRMKPWCSLDMERTTSRMSCMRTQTVFQIRAVRMF
ncbi:MAG: sirohydrochlorin cobaltochelatase [Dysosmobacter welbionis]